MRISDWSSDVCSSDLRFILYTGSAIIDGHDFVRASLEQIAASNNCQLRYWEIDPDVFGEELENMFYADVDRIAAVAAIFTRRACQGSKCVNRKSSFAKQVQRKNWHSRLPQTKGLESTVTGFHHRCEGTLGISIGSNIPPYHQ